MIRAFVRWRLPPRHGWPFAWPTSPFTRGILAGLPYGALIAFVMAWMLAELLK